MSEEILPPSKGRAIIASWSHCDFSSVENLQHLSLEHVLEGHDEVIFLSNAGTIEPIGLVGKTDFASVAECFHVNALAPAAIANAILRDAGPAKLTFVNISSGAAHRPIAGWSRLLRCQGGSKRIF